MKPLKILYASGPVDAASVYNYWRNGEVDPNHCTLPFVYQFFDLCRSLNAQFYVLSRCQRPGVIQDGNGKIKHSPVPFETSSPLLYYGGQLWAGLHLIWEAIAYRPDVLVIQGGRVFPFFLSPIAWLGIKVVPSYHCVLWAKYRPQSQAMKLIWALNRRLFTKDATAILSTSPDITAQIHELTQGKPRPITQFLSIYQPDQFNDFAPPQHDQSCFKILYVGRMRENKGIFDLLTIAQRFRAEDYTTIQIDLCGTGPDLEPLQAAAAAAGLSDRFVCHGHCSRPVLLEKYEQAQVVIVPTTTRFVEGFNQVVLEGVLSGRPVITSAVCPAIHYVREAVMEVPPDDVQAYGDAILKLYHDPELYHEKHRTCLEIRDRFFDLSQGWGAKFHSILQAQGLTPS
ncbi:glycosyltransferase [Spirulina major CS-329]|uniref:glycosyltransferase family 4 protein n=1 Tax=Spirulina TaxID=1154 RepID=UPI00232B41E1|nr:MULTISPECIES: glycosyltransferase [Spirulina]MDB9495536.1 glycosyltransferase [Spirulina subsalsa CS-330]MDB9505511.1 glycosyltransferase [Spirulina major CS-329]